MRHMRRYSALMLLLWLSLRCSSQTIPLSDSSSPDQIRNGALKNFYNGLKENLPFYSGAEYTGHGQGIQGHPFFPDESIKSGHLYYDGIHYSNIPLQYDLVDDAVILMDHTRSYFIKLNSQKVDSFSIDKKIFVRPGANAAGEQDNTLYQQLYHGSIRVLVRREKKVLYRTTAERTIASYKQYNSYYIIKNGEWHQIRSTDQAIQVMKEKKNELKQFVKERNWRFSKEPETILSAIARIYENQQPG